MTSSAIVFERPEPPAGAITPAPAIKPSNELPKSSEEEAEHRRQWGEAGIPPVALLQQLQSSSQGRDTGGGAASHCVCALSCNANVCVLQV